MMEVFSTPLKGCVVLQPKIFHDSRGFFYESYNKNVIDNLIGSQVNFVQDNQSKSTFGTLRGLHFQRAEAAQAKLVRVLNGEVLDVAVDLRPDSDTFGKYFSIKLSGENHTQLFVPRNFAHGFIVLSEVAIFSYKCDNFFNKEMESGLAFDDPDLGIDWILPVSDISLSDKDKRNTSLKTFIKGIND